MKARLAYLLFTLIAGFSAHQSLAQCTNYTISVSSGTWPTEVVWNLTNSSAVVVASGGAPSVVTVCLDPGTYTMVMFDTFGDGWNGASFTITCPNGTIVSTGTLSFGSYGTQAVTFASATCAAVSCPPGTTAYQVNVTGGGYPWEVSWDLTDISGVSYFSGTAPFIGTVCLPPGCYNMNMYDSFGDGWNGATYTVSGPGGIVVSTGTFSSGYSSMIQFPVGGGSCVPNCAPGFYAYQLQVTGGSFPSEVAWDLSINGGSIASGGAPSTTYFCLSTGCYMFNMTDWFGDGWNGATYSLLDANNAVVYSGTLASGSSGIAVFSIGGADCEDVGPVTAGDCVDAVNVCDNLNFMIDPNGYGAINEIPSPGSFGNPTFTAGDGATSPWGSDNYGCLMGGELNSTWMVVNIWSGGWLEFTFGGLGMQAGFYDWIMYSYDPDNTCQDVYNNTLAPVRCNWNMTSTGGTGLATTPPPGGNTGNFEPPLWVETGDQYLIVFSNWSSVSTVVPLEFGGTAVVSCQELILSVEMSAFEASQHHSSALLEWTVDSETENEWFVVEHSTDEVVFAEIGRMPGRGTTNEMHTYTWSHGSPDAGWNYYRIRSVDVNGITHLSEVRPLKFELLHTEVFPNPNSGSFRLPAGLDPADIEVTDLQGRRIAFSLKGQSCEQCPAEIQLTETAPGMYILRTRTGGRSWRFVVE